MGGQEPGLPSPWHSSVSPVAPLCCQPGCLRPRASSTVSGERFVAAGPYTQDFGLSAIQFTSFCYPGQRGRPVLPMRCARPRGLNRGVSGSVSLRAQACFSKFTSFSRFLWLNGDIDGGSLEKVGYEGQLQPVPASPHPSLHLCIPASPYPRIPASLHLRISASPHPCISASPQPCIPTSLHLRIPACSKGGRGVGTGSRQGQAAARKARAITGQVPAL